MQPGTIILFDSNTHFIILEGDFPNTENKQKILLEEKSLEEGNWKMKLNVMELTIQHLMKITWYLLKE